MQEPLASRRTGEGTQVPSPPPYPHPYPVVPHRDQKKKKG
jgi:hypothetical protein